MARNKFCPAMLMEETGRKSNKYNQKCFRNTYLTEDFRNLPLEVEGLDLTSLSTFRDIPLEGKDTFTFASMYLPEHPTKPPKDWQQRFMRPSDDNHNALREVSDYDFPNRIAAQLTPEILKGLAENAKANHLSDKIDFNRVTGNTSYAIGFGCPEDITRTKDPEDKFLILLLYSMFGTRYEEAGVRTKVQAYIKDKDPAWPHREVVQEQKPDSALMNMTLKCGFEEQYHDDWTEQMFLEPAERAATLGDCYVLPYGKSGRTNRKNLMDYMSGIIGETARMKPISLILGGPGSGKTTLFCAFLNREDIAAFENDYDEQAYIYQGKKRIFLYRFNQFNDRNLWKSDKSAETLAAELLTKIKAADIRQLSNTILLLDGFDECAATPEQRRGLLHIFAEEWGRYARIFITCRYHYIDLNDLGRDKDKVSVIELQPFGWEQIRSFICKYKKWNPDASDTQKGLELYRKIMDKGSEESDNIYGIPIILYMVMAMEDNLHLEPGMSKAGIYEHIFQKDNGIYDRMIQGTHYDHSTDKYNPNGIYLKGEKIPAYKSRLIDLTREIAHYMFRTGTYQNALKSEIEKLYGEKFPPFTDSAGTEVDLGKLLSSGLFMIVDTPESGHPSDATLRFVHKSIYEYFVADYLISEMAKVGSSEGESTNLIHLLKEAQVSAEIGDFLQEGQRRADLDMFISGLSSLLTDTELNSQAFENLIYITQRFRMAKDCKNSDNLLFKGMPVEQTNLVTCLRKFRCQGPNEQDFDLTYLDMAGLNLSHTDLSYYDLSGCDCTGTNFRHSQLDFCKLKDTILKEVAFTGASLWQTVPRANVLFDDPGKEIPWTRFEGYLEKNADYGNLHGQLQFGSYPQKKKIFGMDPKADPILWDVLEIRGNRALLWSQDILDVVPYNKEYEDTNWADCSLRKWLNGDFLNKAFTDDERKRLCLSLSEPHRNINRDYKTNQGPAAIDRIFLLSGQELVRYCADSASERDYGLDWEKAKAKVNAYSRGAEGNNKGYGRYWLRSVGFSARVAMSVYTDGDVYTNGVSVVDEHVGVRPALWISLES